MDPALLEPYYIELGHLIQVNKMCQAAAATWLIHDFLVLFNQELEYIWKRPWSRSSFLYLALRYLGGGWGIFFSATFFWDKPSLSFCKIITPMEVWPILCIVITAQVLLQMRVYALYERSKKILAFLIVCFLAELGVMIRMYVNFSSTVVATNEALPGVYFCATPTTPEQWLPTSVYPTLAFEAILVCLSVWAGYQRSKGHFSVAGLRWSRARLIDILVGGNVLYFLCFALMWAVALIILYVVGLEWGQAVNAFGGATSVIAGCRLTLHLREAASPSPHSTHQLSEGAFVFYHSATTATTSEV